MGILSRAFFLQIIEGKKWREIRLGQSQSVFTVPVYRGKIVDRRGRCLALTVKRPSLYADGLRIADPGRVASFLSPVLGMSRKVLERKLAQKKRFIWVKRGLTKDQARRIQEARLPGLGLRYEWGRYYPQGTLAGQVIGFVGVDGIGLEGVEKSYDPLLRQEPRETTAFRDGGQRRLWFKESPPPVPEERYGLQLSIDGTLQDFSETALAEAVRKHHARSGEAVILDVETFQILALANWPPFDPNSYPRSDPSSWRNRAIADVFEPGSVMKVFLMAGVLEKGLFGPQQRIFCEEGEFRLASHVIHDVHPYGWLTVRDVLRLSSNIGAVKLAQVLGPRRYYDYLVRFGFGRKTGVDLPGEASGLLRPWARWRPVDFAVAAFGQGIGVTPLQIAAAVASVANGGFYKTPKVAAAVVDSRNRRIKNLQSPAIRKVLSSRTADLLRRMMTDVVERGGTGTRAALTHYTAAGKTGTAQVADPETGTYARDKVTSVFAGFAPASRPRLAMVVVIHEPEGKGYGGVVAAPVFRRVMEKALPYLGVMPDKASAPSVPGVRKVRWTEGSFSAKSGNAVGGKEKVGVPDLKGLSLKAALALLKMSGFRVEVRGGGRVVDQDPKPGVRVPKGTTVRLTLSEVF